MRNKTYVGAFSLVLSGIICKILGAFFRVPLTNILGIDGIGYFQMAMALYSFALVLVSGGVSIVLSKMVSDALATKNQRRVYALFSYALLFTIVLSLIVGALFAVFSGSISSLQGFDGTNTYLLFMMLLLLGGLIAVFRGFFQGHENMFPTAISQVIEQVVKFSLGLTFAYFLGKISISTGVFGGFLGILLGEIFAFLFLYVAYRLRFKNTDYKLYSKEHIKKSFNSANIKIALSSSIFPLSHAVDALLIIPFLIYAGFSAERASILFGLQAGVVGALLNLPLVLSFAITNAFLPNISSKFKKDNEEAIKSANSGLKLLIFLIVPSALGLFGISPVVYSVIYSKMTAELNSIALTLTLIGSISSIVLGVTQYFFMLLEAKGDFSYVLMASIIAGVLKIACVFLALIPQINIFAVTIGNLVLSTVSLCLAGFRVIRLYNFKISLLEVLAPVLSGLLMAVFVYQICMFSNFSNVLTLCIALLAGVLIYFLLTLPIIVSLKKELLGKTKPRSLK